MAVWETVLGAKWIERLYRLFLFILAPEIDVKRSM
jgi:hypothetical protein